MLLSSFMTDAYGGSPIGVVCFVMVLFLFFFALNNVVSFRSRVLQRFLSLFVFTVDE